MMKIFVFDEKDPGRTRLKKMTLGALFAALAVLLSPLSVPIGPSRCFPFQHAVNAAAGVLIGPFWACGAAFAASFVRNMLGTGTLLAFPGSMFGAAAVGLAAARLPEKYRVWAALAEPLATGTLGAGAASFIASSAGGRWEMFLLLSGAFLLSSLPGAVIGFCALRFLRRSGSRRIE
jgi:energy coupling factor transporter S component ThiW